MPVKTCKDDGRPGYKWGDKGKCYTYQPGDESGRKKAKEKAHLQGAAAGYKFRDWAKTQSWLEKITTFMEQENGSR